MAPILLMALAASAASPTVYLNCEWHPHDAQPASAFDVSVDLDHQTVTTTETAFDSPPKTWKGADVSPTQVSWAEVYGGRALLQGTLDRQTLQVRVVKTTVEEDTDPLIGQCRLAKAPKTAF